MVWAALRWWRVNVPTARASCRPPSKIASRSTRSVATINALAQASAYSAETGHSIVGQAPATARFANLQRSALDRAKAEGLKVFLIIENASWGDIFLHNYRSKLKSQSLLASLLAWQVRFNITIIFCKPSETGQIIHGILYYAAREALKRGDAP